jgi:hypothetical protein
MFEQIFKTAANMARHTNAPYARERAEYLTYCGRRGLKCHTLQIKAEQLLWVAGMLSRTYTNLSLTKKQIMQALVDA